MGSPAVMSSFLSFPVSAGEGQDDEEGRGAGGLPQNARLPGGPAVPHRVGENPRQALLHGGGKPQAHRQMVRRFHPSRMGGAAAGILSIDV